MLKSKLLILGINILLSLSLVKGQEIHVLSLDSTVAIAKERNLDFQMLRENLNVTKYNLTAARNSFKTKIALNGLLPNYSEEYTQYTDASGNIQMVRTKYREYNSYLSISQPVPLIDGNISLRGGGSSFDNLISDSLNLRNRNINTSVGIYYEQPIQSLFFINNEIRNNYKQAKLNYEKMLKQYKREELNLVYTASQAFYYLIQSLKNLEIANEDYHRQETTFKLAQGKYEAGLIREVETLQMEVDLGEASNNQDIALARYKQASNLLKQMLKFNLRDSIVALNTLEYKTVVVDEEKAIHEALMNRSEIRENEIQVELAKIDIRRQRAKGMINGSINGSYNVVGNDAYFRSNEMSSSFNTTFNNMWDRPKSKSIMLKVSVPIFDWNVNRSLVKARQAGMKSNILSLENLKITIERDVRDNVSNLNSSLRRLQLLEKNEKIAERSFDISNARFSNGDINSEELALDRKRFNTSKLSFLSAYIDYKLNLLDLKRKTFYDFEKNIPIDEDATRAN
jgi:outer membrane protein